MSARASKPYSRPNRSSAPEGAWLHDRAPGARVTRQQRQQDSQPAPSTASQVPTCKLNVSNLHYEVTPNDLSTIFGVIGKLVGEPEIRYDRSGRSTGTATVLFVNQGEATRAKNQLDGVLAKGQPMTIKYEAHNPTAAGGRAAVGAKPGSLLGRIAKPPLIDRLGGGGGGPSTASKVAKLRSASAPQPQTAPASTGPGPVRTRGRQAKGPKSAPRKPKTAEQLDKELESYGEQKTSGSADAAGDVEMA